MKMYDAVTLAMAAGAAVGAMLLASPEADGAPIQEDDAAWDCRIMGDEVCGPNNSNGVAPGWYVEGVIFQPWPTINDCRNVGGEIYCDQYFVDPKHVHFSK